jgi:hypothetical protein
MTQTQTGGKWPFRHSWANISLVVIVTLMGVFLLSIASQVLIKAGKNKGQQSVPTAEVEEGVHNAATREGAHVSSVRCREAPVNQWHCTIRLTNGHTTTGSATWYKSQHVLGVNVQVAPR